MRAGKSIRRKVNRMRKRWGGKNGVIKSCHFDDWHAATAARRHAVLNGRQWKLESVRGLVE